MEIELPRLYERDIDVLLQEELIFNEHLRTVVASALTVSFPLHISACRLSVVDETGETDLVAHIDAAGQTGLILIENKIDAAFQPLQPERYRARAKSLAQTDTTRVFCILIAPQSYLNSKSEASLLFDASISYEQIAAAVEAEGTIRAKHRASMLRRAVEQARSAYNLQPVEVVTDLWGRIYAIARAEFPELRMNPPGAKGGRSNWIIFKGSLPVRTTIDWKIGKSTVELSFWKGAPNTPEPNIDLSSLPAGASWAKNGETTAIRISLKREPADWLDLSEHEVRAALTTARALLQFHRTLVQQ